MSTDLATRSEAEAALLAAQGNNEFDDSMYQTPILKIAQPLTKEVEQDLAAPGEFVHSLLGEGLGTKIGFIVAFRHTGRFARDNATGRAYSADSTETLIPERWADLVGEEFVGTPFDEHPDAEEKFKERVNNKEIDWGHGPLISTSFNFTGLAIVPSTEEGEEDAIHPVRLSLKRTDVKAARKWASLIRSIRGAQWDKVFELSTSRNSYDGGSAFNLNVRIDRDSTPEERQKAVELGTAAASGRTTDNQETADSGGQSEQPSVQGGLGV